MIVDTIENCRKYFETHCGFQKSFEFIKKATEENLPAGKYDIDGDNVFASVQEYTSNYEQDGMFEGHRRYIDIQYIVSGIEVMEVMNISKAKVKTQYDTVKDIEFFENNKKADKLVLETGEYGIFFPSDIHKPGLCFEGSPDTVKKIIVKVKL